MDVQLIYNDVLISAIKQSDSVIYIILHILLYYGLSQDIEYSSLCCTVGPCCFLHLIYSKIALVVKNPPANAGEMRHEFSPQIGKILWKRALQLTTVCLPGESHGQRSLMGYSPQYHKLLDMTEAAQHSTVHIRLHLLIPKFQSLPS